MKGIKIITLFERNNGYNFFTYDKMQYALQKMLIPNCRDNYEITTLLLIFLIYKRSKSRNSSMILEKCIFALT